MEVADDPVVRDREVVVQCALLVPAPAASKTRLGTFSAGVERVRTAVMDEARGRPLRRRIGNAVAPAAAASLVAYLLDPISGRRRRAVARDRAAALARRARRTVERRRRYLAGKLRGIAHSADRSRTEQPPPDDVTLARKVETVLFRDPEVPKGSINVMVVGGVVELRGEADRPETIRRLECEAAAVPGVRGVESLLHLPHTLPPNAPPRSGAL